jgi:hypothetical protein
MLPTSHNLLADTINALDASATAGRFNTVMMRVAGEASIVLRFHDLAGRVGRILALMPDEAFFIGAVTNFTPDSEAINRCRRLRDLDVIEREFPPFRRSDVEEMANVQEETRLAWQRRYDEALAIAREHPRKPPETSMVAEIASTAAVLGDFATVDQLLMNEDLRPSESHTVRLVLAIEYARCQLYSGAERVIASLTPPLQGWTSIHLALGLAGRRPWAGYPYADY